MRRFLFLFFIFLSAFASATVHADFSVNRLNGCPPLLSDFTNTSTTSFGTLSYRWDFANGNSSTLANPSAIFNSSGTYRVKLIVSNGIENDTTTKSIVVFHIPQANFQASNVTICLGDTLFLNSNVTLGDAPVTDYAWGFGNGVASSATNTAYVYTQTGLYDITLVIQDSNSCSISLTRQQYITIVPRPQAVFTASPASSCNTSELVSFTNNSVGLGLTYDWLLASGVTSTDPNPTHTYSHQSEQVWLTVTDVNGCSSSVMHKVNVNDLLANFNATPTEVCTGTPVHFSNASNFSGIAQTWDFGDGSISTQQDPDKVYTTPGIYTVTMIGRFGQCLDTVTKIAYITVKQGFNVAITASTPVPGCNDSTVINFANTTSGSAGGLHFLWNFGDGSSSTLENPDHAYMENGNFTATLTVTDSNGCSVVGSALTTISSNKPVPQFFASKTRGCSNTPIDFHSGTAGFVSYLWNFGDGDTSSVKNPVHIYGAPGTYTVSLTVTSSFGCDSTLVFPNYIILDDIVSDFAVSQTFSPCPPFVTLFSSTVNKPGLNFFWQFGDGDIDTAANPTHIYFHPGIFTVSLFLKGTSGCADTVVYPHLIEVQGPYGVFGATPTTGCVPLDVTFTAAVSSNTKSMWCDLGDGGLILDSTSFIHRYTQAGNFNPKFILVDHVGCTVPYDLSSVVAYASPSFQLFDTAVCAGASIKIPQLGPDQYKWSPSPDITCDTCSSLNITPSSSTLYIVKASNPYCSVTDTMKVLVDTLPVLTSSTIKICKNSSFELNVGEAHHMSWSPAIYLSDSSALKPICTPLDSVVYDVTAFNSLGCSVSTQVSVNAINKLQVTALADITSCALDSFQLHSSMVDGPDAEINYSWTPANYLSVSDSANAVGFGLTNESTFQVVVSSGTCESDTAAVTVHINRLPDIQVSENVTTTPHAEVSLWASSTQNLSYEWMTKDSVSCMNCRETNLYPAETQTVYVTGTNDNGCRVQDSIRITVVPCDPESVFLPNVFTPNGDGLNDVLFMSSKVLTSINYFRIFDEWGRMLYETKNISDTWDGKVNGTAASTDVFVYVLEGKCQNGAPVIKYGNITLVR